MTNSEDGTAEPTVDIPGDSQQVSVPNEHSVEGTSEQTPKTDGVYTYPETTDPDPGS